MNRLIRIGCGFLNCALQKKLHAAVAVCVTGNVSRDFEYSTVFEVIFFVCW